MKYFLLIATALFLIHSSVQAEQVLQKNYDKSKSTTIQIDALFDTKLKAGYHPFRVTIRNGKVAPITWDLRFTSSNNYGRSNSYTYTHSIKVEPGTEAIEEILVPVQMTPGHSSTYRRLNISASAPGLDRVERDHSHVMDTSWPSIAISNTLAARNLTRLENKRKGSSGSSRNEHFGSTFTNLPADWRGYSAVDAVMITTDEWQALNKQQKKAALSWVRFGGQIDLYTREKVNIPDVIGAKADEYHSGKNFARYAMGRINAYTWDGKELPLSIVDRYGQVSQLEDILSNEFSKKKAWSMIEAFGTKAFNPTLVFILLIIFAVLVGPVNLFHFAKPGRRHRLFITTPIISLVASLIIICVILFQDGMGGKGQRIAIVQVCSDQADRQLQITQQQISRTGVMLNSGYAQPDRPVTFPVHLPKSRWNPMHDSSRVLHYRFSGANHGGDFFRSRSEQGYHLQTTRPSRSRIELKQAADSAGDTAPTLVSTMEFNIRDFLYIDSKGQIWQSPKDIEIKPGETIALEKSDNDARTKWLEKQLKNLAKTDRQRLRRLHNAGQRYFAIASDPSDLMIPTHSAINWRDDLAIITGQVVANP